MTKRQFVAIERHRDQLSDILDMLRKDDMTREYVYRAVTALDQMLCNTVPDKL